MSLIPEEEKLLAKWKMNEKLHTTKFGICILLIGIIVGIVCILKGITKTDSPSILAGIFVVLICKEGLIFFWQFSRLYSIMEKQKIQVKLSDKEERLITEWEKIKKQRHWIYIFLNLAILISMVYFIKGFFIKNNYVVLGGYLIVLLCLVSIIGLWKFLKLYAVIERLKTNETRK